MKEREAVPAILRTQIDRVDISFQHQIADGGLIYIGKLLHIAFQKFIRMFIRDINLFFHRIGHTVIKIDGNADLEVEKVTEPVIDIKELEERTGSFQLEYMVGTRSGRERTYYQVKEYYRVRFTPV